MEDLPHRSNDSVYGESNAILTGYVVQDRYHYSAMRLRRLGRTFTASTNLAVCLALLVQTRVTAEAHSGTAFGEYLLYAATGGWALWDVVRSRRDRRAR